MRTLLLLIALFVGTSAAKASEPNVIQAMSFVLVAEPKLPDANQLRAHVEKRLPAPLAITGMEADAQKVILLRAAGGTVMIGLIDAPLPKGQIDDLCAGAWYWRQACEATSAHKAHLMVSVLGTSLDKLDASLLLTHVVATLMDSNAIASYWGASLQSRDAFLRQSEKISRDLPPVWLWVNFRVSAEPDKGISLSTQGMETFGLREIEAKDVNRSGREVFSLLVGMGQYLLSKGPIIRDGETIGDSPLLNIRVRQGPSYWREGATVYRVTWPR
jgi:hypothetical protein